MTAVILTSTVYVHDVTFLFQTDPNSRIQTYLKSIKKWLYETELDIVLVENSGYTFEELNTEKEIFKSRFEIISFDEKKIPEAEYLQTQKFGKGRHELFAIDYAYNASNLLKRSNFIIKITCRFYIPEFESFLRCYNLDNYDCLIQNGERRCEIIGSHIKNFAQIFSKDILDEHVEQVFHDRTILYPNILKCKIFDIEETPRGGDDNNFSTL
jgi:hypothetical protein